MRDFIPRKIDINGSIAAVTVKQFDNDSRYIHVTISDEDLSDGTFDLLGCSAALYIQPQNNDDPTNVSFVAGEIADAENGIVTFLLPGGVTQNAGQYECEIWIYEGDSQSRPVISTKPFLLIVEKSIRNTSAVEASQSFSALDRALIEVQNVRSEVNALAALADSGEIPAGTLESEVVDARSGFSTLGGAVRACVRGISYTYDSYYQGSVNMDTGEVVNTTKSVRTDMINPDDVALVHIPNGYQAYLFSYDATGGYLGRSDLGNTGVDVNGSDLKSYKENTITIRITIYNTNMEIDFDVDEFLETHAYIKIKVAVADDIRALEQDVGNIEQRVENIESGMETLVQGIYEINETLSYTYDSYYQGSVNMDTGEVVNTTKSVRTDMINPDDVVSIHVPTGHRAFLFSYNSTGGFLGRSDLGSTGVDLSGTELKAYKDNTATIRITVYNLVMTDDFTVPEFLETGSYIQTDKVETLAQNIAEISDDITEINSDIIEINETLSYTYDSYYQGSVNMDTGVVANTTKSVRTDAIDPDIISMLHIPTGYQAYLFSYTSDSYIDRTNLGKLGVDLTGAQLKACKENTALIRITVYNLVMTDDFTVPEFLETGAYIKTKAAVADDIKSLEQEVENIEDSMETFVSEVEMLKYNDVYYADGLIRRCYNPYKAGGSRLLIGQLHCHDEGWNQSQTGPKLFGTASHEETMQNYRFAGYDFVTLTNYSYFPITHVDDNDMPAGLTWLCDSAEIPYSGGTDEDGNTEKIKHIVAFNISSVDGWQDFVPLKDLPDELKSQGAMISIAHPYWTSTYVKPETLNKLRGRIRFVEVWDGITEYHRERGDGAPNYVTYPDGKGSDYAFEQMLDQGLVTWALAISDVHSGLATNPIFKRGCVKVYADENSRFEILKNLASGNFYASSNVDTSITSVSFSNGTYRIETGSSTAVTKFMKEGGTVVKTVTGNIAEYKMNGSEKYVRAVISWDTGNVDYNGDPIYEKVWVQPIINLFKPDYDDYFDYSLM